MSEDNRQVETSFLGDNLGTDEIMRLRGLRATELGISVPELDHLDQVNADKLVTRRQGAVSEVRRVLASEFGQPAVELQPTAYVSQAGGQTTVLMMRG